MFKNGSFKNKLLPGCSVYCLVSLCVELDHVCFCGTPDATTRKECVYLLISNCNFEIFALVMGSCLCFIFRCSFRMIFIVVSRYYCNESFLR